MVEGRAMGTTLSLIVFGSLNNLHFPWNSRAALHNTCSFQTTSRSAEKCIEFFMRDKEYQQVLQWDFPFSARHGTYRECLNLLFTAPCMLRPNAVYVICFIPLRSFSRDSVQVSPEEILTNKFCLKNVSSHDNVLLFNKIGWCRSLIWAA